METAQLAEEEPEECKFWEGLRKICLLPEQAAFSQSEELHSKLFELRNSALAVFFGCNTLWLTIMFAILSQGEKLTLVKSNFLTLIFLGIYAIMMIVQFITLVIHRISTFLHFIARTPLRLGCKNRQQEDEDSHGELKIKGEITLEEGGETHFVEHPSPEVLEINGIIKGQKDGQTTFRECSL